MTTNLIEAAERARDALMYEIRLIEAETYTETKELIAIHCDLAAAIEAAKSVEPVATMFIDIYFPDHSAALGLPSGDYQVFLAPPAQPEAQT